MAAIEKPSIIFFTASIAGATYFQFKEATPKLWRYILPFIIALFTIALVTTIIVIRRKNRVSQNQELFSAPFVPADSQTSTLIQEMKAEEEKVEEVTVFHASGNSSDAKHLGSSFNVKASAPVPADTSSKIPTPSQGMKTEEKKVEEDEDPNVSGNSSDLESSPPQVQGKQSGGKNSINASDESGNSSDNDPAFKGSDFFTCRKVQCKIFQGISLENIADKQEFIQFFSALFRGKFESPRKRRRKGNEKTFNIESVNSAFDNIINAEFTPNQMKSIAVKLNGRKCSKIRHNPAIVAIANALGLEQSSSSFRP